MRLWTQKNFRGFAPAPPFQQEEEGMGRGGDGEIKWKEGKVRGGKGDKF